MPVGAPIGNNNAGKSKRWEAALERAYAAWPNEPDSTGCTPFMIGLNKAAHNFVKRTMAADADLGFFKETADRFDGKAVQAITGGDGGPLTINLVQFADSNDTR